MLLHFVALKLVAYIVYRQKLPIIRREINHFGSFEMSLDTGYLFTFMKLIYYATFVGLVGFYRDISLEQVVGPFRDLIRYDIWILVIFH